MTVTILFEDFYGGLPILEVEHISCDLLLKIGKTL